MPLGAGDVIGKCMGFISEAALRSSGELVLDAVTDFKEGS